MAKTDRLELRLDAELRGKIDELARLRGWPASAVVRRAVLDAHRAAFPDAAVTPPSAIVEVPVCRALPTVTITELHVALWSAPPTDLQRRLYDAHARGFAMRATTENIDAIITTLFHIAPLRADEVPFILAPPEVHDEIETRVRFAYANVKATEAAPGIARTIRAMRLGLPSPRPSESPRVWVAVGVGVAEDTPGWLTSKLMTGSARDRAAAGREGSR
jgi:hypothetical protein